jgi:hypothetical protein
MRILMAVDDSALAEDVLRTVVSGIGHESTEVLVLHVLHRLRKKSQQSHFFSTGI